MMAVQLLLPNEYVALVAGGLFVLLPKLYYSRGIGFVHPWVAWLLPSYLRLGDVVRGDTGYRYEAALMYQPRNAWGVLLVWGLVIELVITLWIMRKRKRGQLA